MPDEEIFPTAAKHLILKGLPWSRDQFGFETGILKRNFLLWISSGGDSDLLSSRSVVGPSGVQVYGGKLVRMNLSCLSLAWLT